MIKGCCCCRASCYIILAKLITIRCASCLLGKALSMMNRSCKIQQETLKYYNVVILYNLSCYLRKGFTDILNLF